LILSPTALPSVKGNAVTTERWRRCLEGRGLAAQVWPTEERSPADLIEKIRRDISLIRGTPRIFCARRYASSTTKGNGKS